MRIFILFLVLFLTIAQTFGQTVVFTEDFESATEGELSTTAFNGWKQYTPLATVSDWSITNNCPLSGSYSMTLHAYGTYCEYAWDDTGEEIAFYASPIDVTSYTNVTISFKWKCGGEDGLFGTGPNGEYDYGQLCYSYNGTSWTVFANSDVYMDESTTTYTVTDLDISDIDGSSFYLGFRWYNDGSSGMDPGWTVDDIVVKGTPICTSPSSQASAFTSSSVDFNSMTVGWTRGNGDNVLVLAHAGSAVDADPVSSTTYTANAAFGSGQEIGTGNFVVYNGSGTSVNVTGLSESTAYYFAVYEYSNTGPCYNTTQLTGNATTLGYCTPTYSLGCDNDVDIITRVVFNTLDNTSTYGTTCPTRYVNYSGSVSAPNVEKSVSYNLYVTVGDDSGNWVAAWIDWNQDGDFADAGEYYNGGNAGALGTATIPITVPAGATTGITRMRIRGGEDSGINLQSYSCGASPSGYGEAEDYNINVVAGCSYPSTQAYTFTSSGIGFNSMTVGWTRGNGDNVLVLAHAGSAVDADPSSSTTYTANAAFGSGQEIGTGNFVVYNGPGTSVNVTGLSESTTYYFAVYEYSNTGPCYNTTQLTGNATTIGYCLPTYVYDCSTSDLINSFSTTGGTTNITNNSTGCNGQTNNYIYYSGMNVTVQAGNSFNISVESGYYDQGFRIWIDYNEDADFADAGEDVWNSVTDGISFTGTITVPGGTTAGTKRMRVRSSYGTIPQSSQYCGPEDSDYGEVEDYNVIVLATCTPPSTQASNFSTSAMGCNSFTANWTRGNGDNVLVVAREGGAVNEDPMNETTYTANNAFGSGQQIGTGNYVVYNGSGTSVNVTGLSLNTTYYFAVYEYFNSGTCYNYTELTGNGTTNNTPLDPSYTTHSNTTSTITWNWSAASGATSYEVSYDGGAWTNIGNTTNYQATGLSPNTLHSLNVQGTNTCGDGIPMGTESFYSSANTPSAPTVSNPSTTLDVTVNENGNPSNTQFAIYCNELAKYVQAGGSLGATAVWQTDAAWGTVTVTGLACNTTYTFKVKARNGDNEETPWSGNGTNTTTNLLPFVVAATATNVSCAKFDANWNAAVGATGYYIDVDDNADFSSPIAGYNNLDVGNVITYEVTGLSVGTTYYYRIRGYGGCGTGSNSNSITASTSTGLALPSANDETICSGNPATLTASGSSGFYRWYNAASGGTLLGTAANYTTPSLTSTTSYWVEAHDGSGGYSDFFLEDFASGWNTSWTVTDNGTAGSCDNSYVWVDGNPGAQTTGGGVSSPFIICDSDGPGSSCIGSSGTMDADLVSDAIDCSAYSDVHLKFNHKFYRSTYTTQVGKVYVKAGAGAWNLVATFNADNTTAQDINISAYADGQSQVYLKFNLYANEWAYYWMVDDIVLNGNAGGTSCSSNRLQVTVTVNPNPAIPVAQAATSVQSDQMTANWSAAANAEGYYLDVATNVGFTNYVAGFQNLDVGNVTSYVITGLSSSTTYYYRVRAYNTDCGNSNSSNIITQSTSFGCVTLQYPEDGTNSAPLIVTLLWEENTSATSYKLYFGTNNPPTNIENGLTLNSNTYYAGALTANTTYYWQVIPYQGATPAAGCAVASFTTHNPNYWEGDISTSWSTAGNWSLNHTPTSTEDAIIPYKTGNAGNYKPIVNTTTCIARHLVLEKGAELSNGSGTLSLYGDWTNFYGTFNGQTGTIKFIGSNDANVVSYANPSFIIDEANTTSTTIDHTSSGSGDDRGGIAVTPDYLFVTGDAATIRVSSADLTSATNTGYKRDGLFSDLLSGKLYTLWNTTTGLPPVWSGVDEDYVVLNYTVNAIRELNSDMSLGTNITPLVDQDGNPTSFLCKGGQNGSWIYRTGIFAGYGFVTLFADNEGGLENWYVIDIPSGAVTDLGHKNITPDIELSENWAIWGFGEFDGTNYYAIFRNRNGDYFTRINLSTMASSTFASFSNLSDMASVTYSPWHYRWYFHHESTSQFRTVTSGNEVAGFASGAHTITRNDFYPEVFNHFTVNKSGSAETVIDVPIQVNNLTITAGELDVNAADDNYIRVLGNWDNDDTFSAHQGEVTFMSNTAAKSITGQSSTTFYDFTKDSPYDLTVGDAASSIAEVIVSNNFNWIDNDDKITVGTAYNATFDIPQMTIQDECTYQSTTTGTLQVKNDFQLNTGGIFTHGDGLVEFDGGNQSEIKRQGNGQIWSSDCNTSTGWTLTSGEDSWSNVAPTTPAGDHTGGGNCFITKGNSGYGGDDETFILTTPQVSLGGYTDCQLTFWMYMDVEGTASPWDGGHLQGYNGSSWVAIEGKADLPYDGLLSTGYANPYGGDSAWFYDRTTWTRVTVDLSDFDGVTTFKLRFCFGTDNYDQAGTGWAIDDVEISGNGGAINTPITFGNIEVDKAGSQEALLQVDIDVDDNLTITAGELDVNSANYDITLAGNWVDNGTFNERNGEVTFDGNINNRTISNSGGNETFYDLTMNKTTSNYNVSLSSTDITISDRLTLTKGVITTGTNRVITSSIDNTDVSGYSNASFINGNLRRYISNSTDYSFPVGKGTASTDYHRIDLYNSSLTGVTYMDSKVASISEAGNNIDGNLVATEDGTPYTDVVATAEWQLNPNPVPGGSYGVRLFTENHAGLQDNEFGVVKRTDASTTYADWDSFDTSTDIPAAGNVGRTVAGGFAEKTGFTSFSKFAVAKASTPLPVELLGFSAECIEEAVLIKWSTGSEDNSDYFTLERSHDGRYFESIGEIYAAGFSRETIHYNFTDQFNAGSSIYYRLSETDIDGEKMVFDVISITCKEDLTESAVIVTTSDEGNIFITLQGARDKEYSLYVIDDIGRLVRNDKIYIQEGTNTFEFNSQYYRPGIYNIVVQSENDYFTTQIPVTR